MLDEYTAPGDGSVALAQEKGRFASAKAALERPAMMASMKVVPGPQKDPHRDECRDHIPELVRHENSYEARRRMATSTERSVILPVSRKALATALERLIGSIPRIARACLERHRHP